MIGGYDDQGFFRMFFVEGKGFLNAFIKSYCFSNGCGDIICVAGKINFSTLYHHKKTIAIIEQLDASPHIIT